MPKTLGMVGFRCVSLSQLGPAYFRGFPLYPAEILEPPAGIEPATFSLRVSGRNPAVPSNGGLFFRTGPALSPNLSLRGQFSAYFDPDLGLWTTTDADTIRPPSLPL
jgi:hypothetical protein